MAATTALSNILGPDGEILGAGDGDSAGGGSGRLSLGSLFRPMKGVHTVDATNGPLTGDTLNQPGAPAMGGRTLYPWSSGFFNTQSQVWQPAPEGANHNNSGYSACVNNIGARIYGATSMNGFTLESNIDFGFVTESLNVTIIYFNYGGATGNGYHDNQIYVEDENTGNLKKVTRMPATRTATGLHFRTLSFKEAREREFRVMLAMNSWFVGVVIDAPYTLRKSPNKLLLAYNGDSWGEPWGSVLATPVGGAYPTGTYRTAYTPQMLAEATGAAMILTAQSGTGYLNAGNGARTPPEAVHNAGNFNNNSTFFGHSRIDNLITKAGERNPILCTVGGWNDGAIVNNPIGADYAAQVGGGIAYALSKKADLQMLFVGIQPVSSGGYEINHQASNDGMRLGIEGAPQDNIVGFIDEWNMWLDKTMGGQRGNNVNSSDTIHLHAKGAEMVTNWWAASMREMTIPADYYYGMLRWNADWDKRA